MPVSKRYLSNNQMGFERGNAKSVYGKIGMLSRISDFDDEEDRGVRIMADEQGFGLVVGGDGMVVAGL